MIYIVAYDISETKTRTKLANYLESIGRRIQKSVFICDLSDKAFQTARKRIAAITKDDKIEVIMVSLCNACQGRVTLFGDKIEEFEIS